MIDAPRYHWVDHLDNRGAHYAVWEAIPMPRIPAAILDTVVYLYPSKRAARNGKAAGGTGFIVGIREGGSLVAQHKYIVSNHHVVARGNTVVRLNGTDDAHHSLAIPAAEWEFHPDGYDVAACEVSLDSSKFRNLWVKWDSILTDEAVDEIGISIGEDIHIPGRYITQAGQERNTPVLRFGTIAMMPHEPVTIPDGKHTYPPQMMYLLEVRSRCGFSGSPVFARAESVPIEMRPPNWAQHPKFWDELYALLGIETAGAIAGSVNEGMAWAIPSSRVLELLNMPRFKKSREESNRKRDAMKPKRITLTSAKPEEGDPYRRQKSS